VEKTPPETAVKWKSIKVPESLYNKILELAEKLRKPKYAVILDALSFYENIIRKPYRKRDLPRLDKASWYIFKLANSVGAFKENFNLENYQKLLKTLTQINERLGVDTSLLDSILVKLDPRKRKNLTTDDKIEINDATKLIISDIIVKLLLEEKES